MLRLCIQRVVSQQSCSRLPSFRAIISSRLHGGHTSANTVLTSKGDKHLNLVTRTSASQQFRGLSVPASKSDESIPIDYEGKAKAIVIGLERAFSRFEDRCRRMERVDEKYFVNTFDRLTKSVEQLESMDQMTSEIKVNLSLLTSILLRCCGKLMAETPEKARELLAGNLWIYIKEKKIPIDISHYNSLLRVLNENETNFDPQKILSEIHAANLTPDRVTYQRLIKQYCIQGDIAGATQLLEKMKEANLEVNELTYASLIIGYFKQDEPPSLSELFELMQSNGVEPGSRSITAAITSLAKIMDKYPKAIDELSLVLSKIEGDEIQFDTHETVEILECLLPLKNHEVAAKIIGNLTQQSTSNIIALSRLYGVLLKCGELEEVSKLYWRQKPSDRLIRDGNIGIFYIRLLASYKNVPIEHSIKECTKLKEAGYNSKAFHHLYYRAAETGNLDLVRAALGKIAEEEPIKCHFYWPLLAQAKDEEGIINVLKNDLNPRMGSNDLIDTFSQWVWPKFSQNPTRLFELNKELQYDKNLLMAAYLNYSVEDDKILEAIKFISQVPEDLVGNIKGSDGSNEDNHDGDPMVLQRVRSTNERGSMIGRLLNQIAEHTKDPVMVNKAFNLCQLPGQQVTARSVRALVNVHLVNNDFPSALEAFLKLAKEYKITPLKRILIGHCLENKDSENLQKIMDISTEIHGESNSMFDLAVACLRSGKMKQARKIFASPGFRVNPLRVYQTCNSFATIGDVELLEGFVHLTRDMYDINQENLYQTLIDAYERTSNGERALDLWNRMQDEEFQPSRKILGMLARVLEKNNIEVPFQKPRRLETRGRRERDSDLA